MSAGLWGVQVGIGQSQGMDRINGITDKTTRS